MRLNMSKIIFFIFGIFYVDCWNFDVRNVKEIHVSEGSNVRRTYFGYSLLLQRGSSPIVIVGSPKDDAHSGGAIYACNALDAGECHKYNITTNNLGSFNGNFLGIAIDGDENKGEPFIVCAPREVTKTGTFRSRFYNYYMRGRCFYHENSALLESSNIELRPLDHIPMLSLFNGAAYYDSAFGQVGMDVHYIKELEVALLGAPGLKSSHGSMASQSLRNYKNSTIIPKITDLSANWKYVGYTVTSAKIGESTVFITGVPRANNLMGKVVMYKDAKEYKTFTGYEMGSYFGASIVSLDVNNDNLQDLFIGAPMGKGSTYDEGYVYVYENGLGNTAKLYGSRKIGARFGTSIASLGDIDLDSYNDIAVSAPFENNGLGTVYIYMGTRLGIGTTFAQRLSPENFSGNFANVGGFGLGLSRGNDIDENGHNDLAIGAYKSGQVFIMRTKNVIDYIISLESNVTTLKTDEAISFSVRYCIHYSQRSKSGNLRNVLFKMTLSLDHRVQGERIHVRTIPASPGKLACQSLHFLTQPSMDIITPFGISLSVKVPKNVFGKGDNSISTQIPFAHRCGDDHICQTHISLSSIPDKSNFVLGRDQQIDVTVRAENRREPGSLCKLYIKVPDEVALRDKIGCNSDNNTYLVCNFATNLAKVKESKLHFDILSISPTEKKIEIAFEVKCAEDNLGPGAATATIGITIQNSPLIEGLSDPTDVYYNDDDEDGIEMSHTYLVRNSGPSPVKLDVYLLVPMVKKDGKEIFEFVEAKGLLSGVDFYCSPTNQTKKYEKIYDVKSLLTQPLGRTVVVDCFQEDSNCLEIICQGEYLYKTEVAKFEVKVRTNTKLLESHFHQELMKKDVVAYVVSSFIFNSTRIESQTVTLIISSQQSKSIPLLVWILAALLGIIVSALLIFILYKCHFFDRRYRERMNGEILMEQEIDEDSSTLNGVQGTLDEPEQSNL